MRARHLAPLAAGLAVLVVGAGWALLREPAAPRTEHPVAVPEAVRTVFVSATMPMPSAHARRLSTMLEDGAMPRGAVAAEVLTDTDCTPDEQMISRCRNEMRLADGRTIVLRHPHDMTKVPCLAPGERVHLIPAAA